MHQGLPSGRKIESMLCTEVKISGSLPNLELYIYGLSSAFCDKDYAFIDRASYHCYQEAFFRMVFQASIAFASFRFVIFRAFDPCR
jgi:hypothetical protein